MLAPAQFHNRSLADPHTWQAPAQNSVLLEESTRIGLDPSEWRGECPENGALEALSHGTFFQVALQTHRLAETALPVSFHVTGPSQCPRIDKPHRQKPVCGRQARPESGGAGGVGLLYHLPVQQAVFPGYSELVLRTESDFCGQARKQPVNQLIPTNLTKCNKVNDLNNCNNLHNDNNSNN